MSNGIFGYCFTRDTRIPDDMPKEMKGFKRIVVAGVTFVPKDFSANEITYEVSADLSIDSIEALCFGRERNPEELILKLQNPKSIIDPKNGYRIDQILVTPNLWIPPGLQEREWEQES